MTQPTSLDLSLQAVGKRYPSAQAEGGVRWNDPAIGIDWPIPVADITANDRDNAAPLLSEIDSPFEYAS